MAYYCSTACSMCGSKLTLPMSAVRVQGDTAAVGMALAEPMGGGLFTTNIVFGLVVMLGATARVS